MGFEGELALGGPGDARHIEQGCLAIERPYEAPGLGRRIGENPGARRDLVACRNVNADAGVVEPPVMIGAAELSIDDFADRVIGPEMRAPGALHDRLSAGTAINNDTGAEEIHTEDRAALELAAKSNGKPRLMKAGIIDRRPACLLLVVQRFHLAPPVRADRDCAYLVVHSSSPVTVPMPRTGSTTNATAGGNISAEVMPSIDWAMHVMPHTTVRCRIAWRNPALSRRASQGAAFLGSPPVLNSRPTKNISGRRQCSE